MKTKFKTGKTNHVAANFVAEFEPQTLLFSEGDLGTEMYIIQEGEVEVF